MTQRTLCLKIALEGYRETRRGSFWEWGVYNTNVPEGQWQEVFAVARGDTEEQARRNAELIAFNCEGSEA